LDELIHALTTLPRARSARAAFGFVPLHDQPNP
jgi:hypothetical protein